MIRPGDAVTVEVTSGWLTSNPTTLKVRGMAYLDEEGTLRVQGVSIERDADGYFPRGVVVLEHLPAQ